MSGVLGETGAVFGKFGITPPPGEFGKEGVEFGERYFHGWAAPSGCTVKGVAPGSKFVQPKPMQTLRSPTHSRLVTALPCGFEFVGNPSPLANPFQMLLRNLFGTTTPSRIEARPQPNRDGLGDITDGGSDKHDMRSEGCASDQSWM